MTIYKNMDSDDIFYLLSDPYSGIEDYDLSTLFMLIRGDDELESMIIGHPDANIETVETLIDTQNSLGLAEAANNGLLMRAKAHNLISSVVDMNPKWLSPSNRAELMKFVSKGSYFDCLFDEDEWFVSEFCEDDGTDELTKDELIRFLKIAKSAKLDINYFNHSVYLGNYSKIYTLTFIPVVRSLKKILLSSRREKLTPDEVILMKYWFDKANDSYAKVLIFSCISGTHLGNEAVRQSFSPHRTKEEKAFFLRAIRETTLRNDVGLFRVLFSDFLISELETEDPMFTSLEAADIYLTVAHSSVVLFKKDPKFQKKFFTHLPNLLKHCASEEHFQSLILTLSTFGTSILSIPEFEEVVIGSIMSDSRFPNQARKFFALWIPYEVRGRGSVFFEEKIHTSPNYYRKIMEYCSFGIISLFLNRGNLPDEEVAIESLKLGKFEPDSNLDPLIMTEYDGEQIVEVHHILLANENYSLKFKNAILLRTVECNLLEELKEYSEEEGTVTNLINELSKELGLPEELPYEYRERVVLVNDPNI